MTGTAATMYRLLADNLGPRPDKVALVDPGRSVTYAELSDEVDRVAARLRAEGVRPGDRVVIQLRKSIGEVAAMFGAWKIGAVVVNANAALTMVQVAYIVENCRARALILERPGRWTGDDPDLAVLPGTAMAQDTGATAPEAAIDPGALAMIIYTSGSTGRPKGVMLSHRNIRLGAESVIAYLGLRGDDRLLSVLPYSFDAGLNQLTTMLMTGGTTVHQPVVMPSEIVRAARVHAVTGIAGVPPLWNQIVRYLLDGAQDLPALRLVTNTGGKIPPDILAAMPQVFPGVDIYLMYGLTEAFRSTYLPPHRFHAKMGSIGQAIPNARVFVVRKGEGIAGPGQQGELVHAGPLVSMGYWESPELTAQKIRPCPELAPVLGDAPVVWSGDIVRVDEDGDLWFVGRRDDMIKTQGFRVSPTEVEDAVSASGLASDIVAFAVEDEARGQAIHVAATPLPGASEDALLAHCRRAMPGYMIPDRIHPWPGPMPRTPSGKIDRPAVIAAGREAAAAQLSSSPPRSFRCS